jgi:AcrR family transcriptional regulator
MRASTDATRQRLLSVAGPLFAAHGFRDTGIKQICDAAGTNVAAVHYHFGSKLDFYAAVLANAHQQAFVGSPMPVATPRTAPIDAFTTWLRWWIGAMLHPDRPVWLQTLLAREMVDPTPALDSMVDRSIRPMYERLTAHVRKLLPPRTGAAVVRRCTHSVIGQVLFYKHAAPVLERLGRRVDTTRTALPRLVDHVVAFSLAGVAAASTPRSNERRRTR